MSRPYAALFRSVTTSEKLADLPSDTERLFFDWLLTCVDDWGRATASPRKLNATVWPLLGKTVERTEQALESLRVAGLVAIYPSEDGPFVQILDHEDKAGAVGKKDHRRASHWPETADLAPLGPGWPAMAQAGPGWPSRTGACARPCARGSSSESESGSSSSSESESEPRAAPKASRKPKKEPPKEPADRRLVSDYWCGAFQRARGAAYAWQGGTDGGHLTRVLALAQGDVAEVQRRIDRFLADSFWGGKADFGKFVSQWNAMAGDGARGGARDLIAEIMSAGDDQR